MNTVKSVPLGEVADLNPRLSRTPEDEEEVSFVGMASLSAEEARVVAALDRRYVDVRKGYTSFESGDILVAKITPCFENGKIAQANLPKRVGVGSTEFHVVRPKPGVADGRYLHHFLRKPEVRFAGERRMTGSGGQRRVPMDFLASLVVPLPPVPEQRRIAAILDQTDALQGKRREALMYLERLTQAIFVDMFGDPAANPSGWPTRSLKELGKVSTGGTPPSALDGMFGGEIPFVTPGDLESNQPIRRTVTEAGAKEAGTVRAGAALVCCIGATIGKMGLATVRSSFNQQLNAVEWFSDVLVDQYGLAALQFFKPTIIAWGASTTLPILKKSSFERLSIPVPPLPLQHEFASRSREATRLIEKMRRALELDSSLFAALRHLAFQGEL